MVINIIKVKICQCGKYKYLIAVFLCIPAQKADMLCLIFPVKSGNAKSNNLIFLPLRILSHSASPQ